MKFEQSLEELKNIVKDLESDDLSLEESIEKFKKGIDLSNKCKQQLEEAKEVVVEKMKAENGNDD